MEFSLLIVPQNSLNVANTVSFKRHLSHHMECFARVFCTIPKYTLHRSYIEINDLLRAKCIVAATETAATQRECSVDFIVTT